MYHMLPILTHLVVRQSLRWFSLHVFSVHGLQFFNFYSMKLQNRGLVARTQGHCMTSNFPWQLSGSIWVTYCTFALLGWLEVWYLKSGLQITSFISMACYINFEAVALCPWRTNWAKNWHVTSWGCPTAMVRYVARNSKVFIIRPTLPVIIL